MRGLILALVLGIPGAAEAALCALTWDANTETDLAGYRVYTALASQGYGAGSGTETTQTTLTCEQAGVEADGLEHFFVVTAFDLGGLESAFSNEVSTVLVIPPKDTDGDGVPDDLDHCPTEPGPFTNNGCPVPPPPPPPPPDADGDGVPDSSDACPTIAGPATNSGCPVAPPPPPPPPPDTDHDGVPDETDACPTIPGPASTNGCPAPLDTDSDGVPDATDACPTIAGPVSNNGCPVPPPPEPVCLRYNPHGKCTKWDVRH